MVRNKTVLNLGILLALFWSFLAIASAQAENTTAQILTQVDEILAMNPPKAGEKIQLINVAQTDAVSVIYHKSFTRWRSEASLSQNSRGNCVRDQRIRTDAGERQMG